mgnify:CR=1 FL=1
MSTQSDLKLPCRLSLPERLIDRVIAILRPLQLPKYRLLDPFVPKTGHRAATVWGAQMELDLSDRIQRSIYFGCYEREETKWFQSVLKPGAVVVDVGANVGYFTALASQLVGATGRVFAVEPSPRCFALLKKCLRSLSIQNVHALQLALGEESGVATLYEPLETVGNLDSTMTPQANARPVQVVCSTLDECVEQWRISQIDLLKIDVEGFESRVFRGATKTLEAKRIHRILCEVNEYWLWTQGSSGAELTGILRSFGFDAPVLEPPAGSPPPGHKNYLFTLRA